MGEMARCLFDRYPADYLIRAMKDDQPTMLDDLCDMDFSACSPTRPRTMSMVAATGSRIASSRSGTALLVSADASRPYASNAKGIRSTAATPARK